MGASFQAYAWSSGFSWQKTTFLLLNYVEKWQKISFSVFFQNSQLALMVMCNNSIRLKRVCLFDERNMQEPNTSTGICITHTIGKAVSNDILMPINVMLICYIMLLWSFHNMVPYIPEKTFNSFCTLRCIMLNGFYYFRLFITTFFYIGTIIM